MHQKGILSWYKYKIIMILLCTQHKILMGTQTRSYILLMDLTEIFNLNSLNKDQIFLFTIAHF